MLYDADKYNGNGRPCIMSKKIRSLTPAAGGSQRKLLPFAAGGSQRQVLPFAAGGSQRKLLPFAAGGSQRKLLLVLTLFLSIIGGLVGTHRASAARTAGILLFTAPSSRVVAAGETQKVWVHTLARAGVTLTVDYGNGQVRTRHGTTDKRGVYLFRWAVGYTGSSVVLAHYWVRVERGALFATARGNFVLFPAPLLHVRLEVLTPILNVGETLR